MFGTHGRTDGRTTEARTVKLQYLRLHHVGRRHKKQEKNIKTRVSLSHELDLGFRYPSLYVVSLSLLLTVVVCYTDLQLVFQQRSFKAEIFLK